MTIVTEEERVQGTVAAADEVRRIPELVEITAVTQRALDIIHRDDLPYLPVVVDRDLKPVGIVMGMGNGG